MHQQSIYSDSIFIGNLVKWKPKATMVLNVNPKRIDESSLPRTLYIDHNSNQIIKCLKTFPNKLKYVIQYLLGYSSVTPTKKLNEKYMLRFIYVENSTILFNINIKCNKSTSSNLQSINYRPPKPKSQSYDL